MRKRCHRTWRALGRLRAGDFGGVSTIFAIILPVAAILACGAIDLASVAVDKQKLQDAADAAALFGAKQLGVANASGVTDRAAAYARNQLNGVDEHMAVATSASEASDGRSITVVISASRTSFFGSLLPPGGWRFQIASTGKVVGVTPLCVLSTSASGTAAGGGVALGDSSQMTAPGCLVQSDSDAAVTGSAQITAAMVQTVGAASGAITPTPETGAPAIADPFANTNFNIPPLCDLLDVVYDVGVNTLSPGVHCGTITVRKNATVYLLPGEHYFEHGHLLLQENATLSGSNVALIFDNTSNFKFGGNSEINLQGRTSGPYSGFVIATTPANTGVFTISSDAAHTLLGTVYIPNAELSVSGLNNRVADQSAWTVVVAKGLVLAGTSNLVINANYAGSGVPVPSGVGPDAKVALVK